MRREYFLNLSMCTHVDSSRLYLYRDRKKVFRGQQAEVSSFSVEGNFLRQCRRGSRLSPAPAGTWDILEKKEEERNHLATFHDIFL